MPYNVRVSGTWRSVSSNFVRVGGTWRTVTSMWVRVAGTWRQFFSSARAFTALSSNYPDPKGAVMVGVQGTTLLRFGGESPFTNLAYRTDVNNATVWTQVTNLPVARQGPFGGIKGDTIWGFGGWPSTSSVHGTNNLGTSWTTGASCSSAYWHATTPNGCAALSGDILKAGGFSSSVESFSGSSWTSRGSTPTGMGFGTLVDSPTRSFYMGGPGSESNSASIFSFNGSSWTTETSQPVATRRTYGTELDGRIIELGGEQLSVIYRYSGTGGTWTAGIAVIAGSTYTTSTVSGTAAYGSGFNFTWRYA